jgi:hypothetical protein
MYNAVCVEVSKRKCRLASAFTLNSGMLLQISEGSSVLMGGSDERYRRQVLSPEDFEAD